MDEVEREHMFAAARDALLTALPDAWAVYVSDPDRVLAWEASAMSRYARHREQIRDILADFSRTGAGYRLS